MPTVHALLSVTVAGFALSLTPGPSMLYVLSHTIGHSRAAGIASAVGLCLGGILLSIATALGLAALFKAFPWLLMVLPVVGSAYLMWLGGTMINSARGMVGEDLSIARVGKKPISRIVWQGVLVEVVNPKTVLFFALFLPPFVAHSQAGGSGAEVMLQLLLLGALVPLTAIPSDLAVAYAGGALARRVNSNVRSRQILAVLGGLILIAIALKLLWTIAQC